jgi:hypothetical protein
MAEEGGARFPHENSFRWFCRKHGDRLRASGQYFPAMGPPGTLVGPGFSAVVMQIMLEEARGEIGAAA